MIKRTMFIVLLVLPAIIAGCPARSLSPLFSEKETLIHPQLFGSWQDTESDEVMIFRKRQNFGYTVSLCEKDGDTSVFHAVSGTLNGIWFLDTSPSNPRDDHHLLPIHLFHKLSVRGDTMQFASLEADWLKKKIEKNELSIEHALHENEIILTASTAKLQNFISSIASNDTAFPNASIFVRKK